MSNSVFPALPGIGWPVKKTPIWSTKTMRAVSGKESTLALYSYPIYQFELTFPDVLRDNSNGSFSGSTEFRTLLDFYNSVQGKFDSWLFDDVSDDSVIAQQFGEGDGNTTVFQLIRSLKTSGFLEPVQNLNGSPQIFKNDWQGNQLQYSVPRTNLLEYSEQFDNAVWSKANVTVTANNVTAPDGNLTADSILETATTTTHYAIQNVTKAASALTYTLIFWVRPINGRNTFRVQLNDTGSNAVYADVDMGAVTAVANNGGSFTGASASITAVAGGWFFVTLSGTTNTGTTVQALFQTTDPAGTTSFLGDITKGIVLWGADLKQSGIVSNYIKTTSTSVTQTDYSLNTLGVVTFGIAPITGAILTWTGNFYYRCRFTTDEQEFVEFMSNLWSVKSIKFQTVKQ